MELHEVAVVLFSLWFNVTSCGHQVVDAVNCMLKAERVSQT